MRVAEGPVNPFNGGPQGAVRVNLCLEDQAYTLNQYREGHRQVGYMGGMCGFRCWIYNMDRGHIGFRVSQAGRAGESSTAHTTPSKGVKQRGVGHVGSLLTLKRDVGGATGSVMGGLVLSLKRRVGPVLPWGAARCLNLKRCVDTRRRGGGGGTTDHTAKRDREERACDTHKYAHTHTHTQHTRQTTVAVAIIVHSS